MPNCIDSIRAYLFTYLWCPLLPLNLKFLYALSGSQVQKEQRNQSIIIKTLKFSYVFELLRFISEDVSRSHAV